MVHERAVSIHAVQVKTDELCPIHSRLVQGNREAATDEHSAGQLPSFEEDDSVSVARKDFHVGEKLALRWRGLRRTIKTINSYVNQVENLRNGELGDVHIGCPHFHSDRSLNSESVMTQVVNFEMGMPLARLMELADKNSSLKVHQRPRLVSLSAVHWGIFYAYLGGHI